MGRRRRSRSSTKVCQSAPTATDEPSEERSTVEQSPYFEDGRSPGEACAARRKRLLRKRLRSDSSERLLNSTESEGAKRRCLRTRRGNTSCQSKADGDKAVSASGYATEKSLRGKPRVCLQRLAPTKRKADSLDEERHTAAVNDTAVPKTAISNDEGGVDVAADEMMDAEEEADKDCTSLAKQAADEESESDDDWEDVPVGGENEVEMLEEVVASQSVEKKTTTSSSILVDVSLNESKRNRKAKSELQRLLDKFTRELHKQKCKVHLLCLLANGFYQNSLCCNSLLQGVALSQVPSTLLSKMTGSPVNRTTVQQVLDWYFSKFSIKPQGEEKVDDPGGIQIAILISSFQSGVFPTLLHYVQGLVAVFRVLQVLARLVFSLQPMALKQDLAIIKSKSSSSSSPKSPGGPRDDTADTPFSSPPAPFITGQKQQRQENASSAVNASELLDGTERSHVVVCRKLARTKRRARRKEKKPSDDEKMLSSSPSQSRRSARLRRDQRTEEALQKSIAEINSEEELEESECDGEELFSLERKKPADLSDSEASSDSDFEISSGKVKHFRSPQVAPRPRAKSKRTLASAAAALKAKMLSPLDSQAGSSTAHTATEKKTPQVVRRRKSGENSTDHWLEVYITAEEQWACIDVEEHNFVPSITLTENATRPVSYVMAFDGDNRVKDVTQRYVTDWMTRAQKRRIDSGWWKETLAPYTPLNQEIDIEEDLRLQVDLEAQPFPVSVADFKNHPLYALKRHLLKFEAIYPEDAPVLGFIKGEAIYSRSCVKTMHTRETWLKEGLVVKEGEKPYKMVKARSKRSTPAHERGKLLAETFGEWQTEEYIPPAATNGKVPRNQYGNIELFKPSMLPGGTRHMQVPGLQRVAKKLGIDCAEAMVGWDQHGGYSHPVFDGIVVCEEFADTLMDAWQQEREEEERKRQEKREKHILSNWYKLTKGLLIRQRVRRQFRLQENGEDNGDELTGQQQDLEHSVSLAPDSEITLAWPNNRKDGIVSADSDGHCHVFPREQWQSDVTTASGWTKKCACGLTVPVDFNELNKDSVKNNSCLPE